MIRHLTVKEYSLVFEEDLFRVPKHHFPHQKNFFSKVNILWKVIKSIFLDSREKSVFLDLLLEISKDKKLTDEEIRDEVATVMLGVSENEETLIDFFKNYTP